MKGIGIRGMALIGCIGLSGVGLANNIQVSNVSVTSSGPGYTHIECDVSWNNSWRASWAEGSTVVTNWDAAWIFVKCRAPGGNWVHATLSTNNAHHTGPAGATLEVGLTDDKSKGTGVFLYRSAEGSGTWSNRIKLRWNYSADSMPISQSLDVNVQGIEMVYVPQGAFKVGSGGALSGELYEGGGGTSPFQIANAGPIACENAAGSLWGASQAGINSMGGAGTIPSAFPNGFNAFYCMKYELTEGQWVGFFNTLTSSQKTTRDITSNTGKNSDLMVNRNSVAWTSGDATTTRPDRVCNFLGWPDLAAYADWAGLRPMTELEFEKACRGPVTPVAQEYTWGTAVIMSNLKNLSGPEDGTESVTTDTSAGAAHYALIAITGGDTGEGALRAGIFATASSTRASSGASYWGIMEMSGNLYERIVTIGDVTKGRAFTGLHGDGALASATDGNANVTAWPGTDAVGAGVRGGSFADSAAFLMVSHRGSANNGYAGRQRYLGGRGVRTAP